METVERPQQLKWTLCLTEGLPQHYVLALGYLHDMINALLPICAIIFHDYLINIDELADLVMVNR